MTDFDTALTTFVIGCQGIVDEYNEKFYPETNFGTKLSVDPKGRRYARVVTKDNFGGNSAYCFVDKTNGNVLKSASWKTPAKGARGNIYNEDKGLGRMGPYGAGYNR